MDVHVIIVFVNIFFAVVTLISIVVNTKDLMVGRKQREIETLRKRCAEFEDAKAQIYMIIYGMGGPLNDNVKGYTFDQMRDFRAIIEDLNYSVEGDDV